MQSCNLNTNSHPVEFTLPLGVLSFGIPAQSVSFSVAIPFFPGELWTPVPGPLALGSHQKCHVSSLRFSLETDKYTGEKQPLIHGALILTPFISAFL